jgi:pilus assembly protein CpaC
VTLLAGFSHSDVEILLEALAEDQYVRLLAEPNLTALSGEEASFLAGGEFPIPIVQGGTGGSAPSITVVFKEFGVLLNFRPLVLGDGTIRLYVSTEASDLSEVGAVEIQGFRIPAITTRRAETTLQLKSGQTFGMAGLVQQISRATSSRLPWLGELPVLGPLFRSVKYQRGETELLVLVTASLVEPLSTTAVLPVPGVFHGEPDDWELYAEGRIEGKPRIPAPPLAWPASTGLGRLRGPSPWASYGAQRAERDPRAERSPSAPAEGAGKRNAAPVDPKAESHSINSQLP